MRKTIVAVLIAALLWFVMFSPWTAPHINFWYTMTCSALTLTTLSTIWCREWLKDLRFSPRAVAAGLSIAFALWWVFWTGDKVSQWMFGFARSQVDMIYSMKGGTPPAVIAVLLLLVIGPAEEIFWRGFIQRRMMARWGANAGLIAATACLHARPSAFAQLHADRGGRSRRRLLGPHLPLLPAKPHGPHHLPCRMGRLRLRPLPLLTGCKKGKDPWSFPWYFLAKKN